MSVEDQLLTRLAIVNTQILNFVDAPQLPLEMTYERFILVSQLTSGGGSVPNIFFSTIEFTPTNGQTTFTLPNTLQFIISFARNGNLELENADWTRSGNTITYINPEPLSITDKVAITYTYTI